MTSKFAVRPFPLLKKKITKRNINFFSGQMYFQDILLLPRPAATIVRMNRLHVVTFFNLSGATRNEKNRKCQANSANILQTLAKINSEPFLMKNYDCLVYERSSWELSEENCERRVELNFRKVELNCSVW